MTVGQPGTYQVLVEARSGEGDFQIAGGWIPFPPVAVEPDPDGRPTGASVLEPGPAVENSLHLPGGDHWDWYAVMPKADRMVTVVVEAPTGDLVLEMFETGQRRAHHTVGSGPGRRHGERVDHRTRRKRGDSLFPRVERVRQHRGAHSVPDTRRRHVAVRGAATIRFLERPPTHPTAAADDGRAFLGRMPRFTRWFAARRRHTTARVTNSHIIAAPENTAGPRRSAPLRVVTSVPALSRRSAPTVSH